MTNFCARDLAIVLCLGMIQPGEAIEWADTQIGKLDEPPYWLIELSTSQGTRVDDLLKLIPEKLAGDPPSDTEFLGAMAVRFIDQMTPLNRIMDLLLNRFCFGASAGMTGIRQQVYLIDDQLDWDPPGANIAAREFLTPYVAVGRELLNRVRNMEPPRQDLPCRSGGGEESF